MPENKISLISIMVLDQNEGTAVLSPWPWLEGHGVLGE